MGPVFKERLNSLLQCLFADCHKSQMFAFVCNQFLLQLISPILVFMEAEQVGYIYQDTY